MFQFLPPLFDSLVQLASSNIMKTSDLSRKKNQAEVKYWIRGTTGETRFHSILFARFYPGGDPGQYPAGTLVEIY